MGNTQTQTDPSASYLSLESGGKTSDFLFPPPIETVLPTTIHTAPIHALCTLDCTHLLSGGADKVGRPAPRIASCLRSVEECNFRFLVVV